MALLTAALAGGCAHLGGATLTPTAANPSPWASPTATMRWNEYAVDLIARNQSGQLGSQRTLAYLNLAINNAIVAAQKKGGKPGGAASGAAATMLAFASEDEAASCATRGRNRLLGVANRATSRPASTSAAPPRRSDR